MTDKEVYIYICYNHLCHVYVFQAPSFITNYWFVNHIVEELVHFVLWTISLLNQDILEGILVSKLFNFKFGDILRISSSFNNCIIIYECLIYIYISSCDYIMYETFRVFIKNSMFKYQGKIVVLVTGSCTFTDKTGGAQR